MSEKKIKISLPSDTEILMERYFDAPIAKLWEAYSDPNLVAKWWGGTTTVIDQMEFKVGGKWRYLSKDEEGNEHAFRGEYKEIVPMKKLTYTFEYEPLAGHICTETISFEEVDGRSKLTGLSVYSSKEDRDGMLSTMGDDDEGPGADTTWNRLEAIAASLK